GDDRYAPAGDRLVRALRDDSARVRGFAAIALGRLQFHDAVPGLVRVLAENDDVDAGLRHASVMGLVGCAAPDELAALVGDRRHAVRLGALLTMRRRGDAHIAAFLDDPAADIWAEAVRAIYDLPIADAMPALIAHFGQPVPAGLPDKAAHLLALRLIHAAARHGDDACALRLAAYAAGTAGTPELRAAALKTLLTWNHPNSIDPVLGRYRPALLRDKALDTTALKDAVLRIVARGENESLGTAVILANQAGFPLDDRTLLGIVDNTVLPAGVRIEGLHQLVARTNADLRGRLDRLMRDDQAEVRNAAFDALASYDQPASVMAAAQILDGIIGANPVTVITERSDGDWSELGIHAPALKPLTSDSSPLLGAVVRWVPGFAPPHKDAGAVDGTLPRLLDDQLPANDDDPAHSTWLDGGESRFVLDLQRSIEVARIATYSWHKAERAAQQFVLYGADGATMPDPASGTLGGWTRIARIDTTGQQAGGKQASCVLANAASMGRYRWLLWQNLAHGVGTFYAKLNVFAAGRPLPGVVRVIAARTDGEWGELPMGAPADGDDAAGKGVTWVAGAKLVGPHPDAGAQGQMLPRLTGGGLPVSDDDTLHSTWLDGGESRFVLDLLQPTALARISTYSWHKAERAGQHYALWGANGQQQPDAAGEDLWKSGWKRFAQVDTGWLGKGGKQGSAVVGVSGDLGTWRWVLWQNLDRKPMTGTFYARLNVFAVGTTVPAIASAPDRVQLQAKQHVVLGLGKDPSPAAAALLGTWVDRLVAGEAPPTLALELRDAAKARSEPPFAAALAKLTTTLPAGDALAPFRIALAGGDADRGRDVFRQHAAQCIRCHAVDGDGGNVGPELRGVANRLSRERILESLIVPNAVVAPGFGTASATLTDGSSVSGVWLGQTAAEVVIRPAGAKEVHIPLAQVAKLTPPISPMPPMGGMLNSYELRDVLAFLNSLH
nr:c-type cytochrome [Planctomycetota bacterium]